MDANCKRVLRFYGTLAGILCMASVIYVLLYWQIKMLSVIPQLRALTRDLKLDQQTDLASLLNRRSENLDQNLGLDVRRMERLGMPESRTVPAKLDVVDFEPIHDAAVSGQGYSETQESSTEPLSPTKNEVAEKRRNTPVAEIGTVQIKAESRKHQILYHNFTKQEPLNGPAVSNSSPLKTKVLNQLPKGNRSNIFEETPTVSTKKSQRLQEHFGNSTSSAKMSTVKFYPKLTVTSGEENETEAPNTKLKRVASSEPLILTSSNPALHIRTHLIKDSENLTSDKRKVVDDKYGSENKKTLLKNRGHIDRSSLISEIKSYPQKHGYSEKANQTVASGKGKHKRKPSPQGKKRASYKKITKKQKTPEQKHQKDTENSKLKSNSDLKLPPSSGSLAKPSLKMKATTVANPTETSDTLFMIKGFKRNSGGQGKIDKEKQTDGGVSNNRKPANNIVSQNTSDLNKPQLKNTTVVNLTSNYERVVISNKRPSGTPNPIYGTSPRMMESFGSLGEQLPKTVTVRNLSSATGRRSHVSELHVKISTPNPEVSETISAVIHNNFSKFVFDRDPSKKSVYPLTLSPSSFLIDNPSLCAHDKEILFLIIVHTAIDHFKRRQVIRDTYANKYTFTNITIKTAFLLGTTPNPTESQLIEKENSLHRDIVQGNFIDSYRNLSHKGVLGFSWILTHCPMADLVIKVDDDMYLNMFKVAKHVFPWLQYRKRHMLCEVCDVSRGFPIHRGSGAWTVARGEFRHFDRYPTYCRGPAVFMTPDIILPLLEAARKVPIFWIDDVYLYGMLPLVVKRMTFANFGRNYTHVEDECLRQYESKGPANFAVCKVKSDDNMYRLWRNGWKRIPEMSKDMLTINFRPAVDNFIRNFPPMAKLKLSDKSSR